MEWHYKNAHSHTTSPLPHHHSVSPTPTPRFPLPLQISTPYLGLHSPNTGPTPVLELPTPLGDKGIVPTPYPIIIHTKVKRGADTAWCHSKLGPSSTSHRAGEEQFSPHSLTPGGESVSRGLGREGSGKVATSKATQAWPCLGTASSMGREKTQPARSAPQARDPLAKQWRGFQHPSIETPGTLSSPRALFLEHPRELQLGPYPPLGKCRAVSGVRWEWIRLSLEPLRLSHVTE